MHKSAVHLQDLAALAEEAAQSPTGWDDLIGVLGRHAPGAKIVLQAVDSQSLVALPAVFAGWSAAEMKLYEDYYNTVNVFLRPLLNGTALAVRHASDLVTPDALDKSEFCRDFLFKQGRVTRGTGIKIFAEESRIGLLTVNYEECARPEYDRWFADVLRAIGPKIRNSLHLGRYIHKNTYTLTVKTLADAIARAAFVINSSLKIVSLNEVALAWLQDVGLSDTGLASLAGSLKSAMADGHGPATGWTGSDVALSVAGRHFRATAIRLTDNPHVPTKMRPLIAVEPLWLLVVQDDVSDVPASIARRYGFTKAEERLARYLALGHSLAEIAELLAISRETSRSHLKSIFAKTGKNRQVELVILLTKGRD